MSGRMVTKAVRAVMACSSIGVLVMLSGCASDGYSGGNVSTSVSVGYGYGGYYGPYYGGGYYAPYPPVVVLPPDGHPGGGQRPDRPTTLPGEVGGPSVAPSRPPTSSRPTTRPAPRPATRPMPRGGRR